jgi:hypothetical protein
MDLSVTRPTAIRKARPITAILGVPPIVQFSCTTSSAIWSDETCICDDVHNAHDRRGVLEPVDLVQRSPNRPCWLSSSKFDDHLGNVGSSVTLTQLPTLRDGPIVR